MTSFLRNTPLFAISQGLMISAVSLVVTCSALVGLTLAADKSLATLPLAVMFITTMLGSIPASFLLEKIGRKKGFMLATLIGMSASAISTYAIMEHQFWVFVSGIGLLGLFNSFGNYFRFAAADAVSARYKSRAISYVMLGGVVAAFVGPNLANIAKNWVVGAEFAGSYAALVVVYILIFLALSATSFTQAKTKGEHDTQLKPPRPLKVIAKQPKFILAIVCAMLGYGVMSLIMTATPLAMKHHNHSFADTSFIIQYHLLGMFIPSFFTGSLIRSWGIYRVLFAGVLSGFACVAINLSGHDIEHYWTSLVLLGVCWNFLFIGGTTLLTETYTATERAKAQALNDFIVFSTAAFASLSAGYLQHQFGWQVVNIGVIPLLMLILVCLLWIQTKPLTNPIDSIEN